MQYVNVMMLTAPPQASQRKEIRAHCCSEQEHTNLNVAMVHEIGETSSIVIMELSDGSNSE
jgi:hypothetical protein